MNVSSPKDLGLDSVRLDRISDWMERYVEDRKFPGSSVLIARGGEEVYYHQAGSRDLEQGVPFKRDSVARIYSMTKPITSVALMMLAEAGWFSLETPISEFLPAFSDMSALVPDAQDISQSKRCATPTIHQLLTHTSGLSYAFNPGPVPAAMQDRDIQFGPGQGELAEMVDKLAKLPLAFRPGERWEYSVGIDVVGRIIEVVSGQSLSQFFEENILAPLGMENTAFSVPAAARDRFCSLYTPLAGDAMDLNAKSQGEDPLRLIDQAGSSPFEAATLFSGGGGLVGTIDDYMAFAEMLRCGGTCKGGRILSPRTLEFMMRNHLPGDIASMGPQSFAEQPMEGMGFGIGGAVVLDPARARCPGSVGDFSWGGMASTFFWVDRELDLSVVFFTQLSPSSSYPTRAELKALIHGAIVN